MNAASNWRVMVCIPAFNESKNIAEVVKKASPYCSEVIVCDDGSSDDTSDVAKAAGAKVVKHPSNKGYGSAIKTLFAIAQEKNADIMVTIDSDGQHNPDQIPSLIEPILNKQADIVIGSRFLAKADREKVPLYRTIGIKTITKFTQLASYENITDAQSGFRAYSKKALSSIKLSENGMGVSTEILLRARQHNHEIKEVPVTITYDVEDASTHNPISHGLGVLLAILRFVSIRHPLAFYGIPGLGFLAVAAFFFIDLLHLFYTTSYLSTNMLIIGIGSLIIGLILAVAGIILYVLAGLRRPQSRYASFESLD